MRRLVVRRATEPGPKENLIKGQPGSDLFDLKMPWMDDMQALRQIKVGERLRLNPVS